MKWRKVDQYHIESECKGYRISKMYGPPMNPVYLAWKRRAIRHANGDWGPTIIGKADSSEEAIAICKADAEAARSVA